VISGGDRLLGAAERDEGQVKQLRLALGGGSSGFSGRAGGRPPYSGPEKTMAVKRVFMLVVPHPARPFLVDPARLPSSLDRGRTPCPCISYKPLCLEFQEKN